MITPREDTLPIGLMPPTFDAERRRRSRSLLDKVGTLHDMRFLFLDNDTR